MFLQKLKLDPTVTYETSASVDNVVENMGLQYKHIPIITLYSSKAPLDEDIEKAIENKTAAIELSVSQYKQYKDRFDSSHIILPKFDFISDFGFSPDDFDKPLIVLGNHGFAKLPLSRFGIFAEKNDRFVAVYILSQLFKATIFTKEVNRMKIFCRIFELDCKVLSLSESVDTLETECAIFVDCHKEVFYERIFLIGSKPSRYERLDLDLNSAGKYRYRICSVMQQVSKNVAKRIDSFDYSVYSHING
ncbi:hypothetical protein PAEPH01_0159 [Pancytospora epiphaga]|nr:hypothetical protein PAEPH01_0159 [Pancytospora epiphaga]